MGKSVNAKAGVITICGFLLCGCSQKAAIDRLDERCRREGATYQIERWSEPPFGTIYCVTITNKERTERIDYEFGVNGGVEAAAQTD